MTKPDNFKKSRIPQMLAIVFGAAILLVFVVFILLPHGNSRPVAPILTCKNNLKNIVMALHNYAAAHNGNLPPAYTVDAAGRPLHSWRTLLLPYIDRRDLADRVDWSKPWDDPVNSVVRNTSPQVYACPSADLNDTYTSYLAVVGPNGTLLPTVSRNLSEFDANGSEAIIVIDMGASQAVPWMSPQDATDQMVLSLGSNIKSPHEGGTNVANVDGSVGFLSEDTSAAELRNMITMPGNSK